MSTIPIPHLPQRSGIHINQDETKEEKYQCRNVENTNERSVAGGGVMGDQYRFGNQRRNVISRWPERNHSRRGWKDRRIGLPLDKQRRIRLKQEGRELYGSESPLHFSIKTNNINRVKQLLRTTDPNKYHEGTGETPLHLACRLGQLSIVKLLRRHPGIKTDLLTKGGPQSVNPAGCTPISLVKDVKDKHDIIKFLRNFKPKDNLPIQESTIIESELQMLVRNIEATNETYISELKVLRPEFNELDQENKKLKKELESMKKQDVEVMGTELPREKPNDTRKLAEVLANVRKLQQELTACQERLWDEKENEAKCSVCVDRPKDTVLFPCGHLFCSTCCKGFIVCAKCQKPIEQRVQTSK